MRAVPQMWRQCRAIPLAELVQRRRIILTEETRSGAGGQGAAALPAPQPPRLQAAVLCGPPLAEVAVGVLLQEMLRRRVVQVEQHAPMLQVAAGQAVLSTAERAAQEMRALTNTAETVVAEVGVKTLEQAGLVVTAAMRVLELVGVVVERRRAERAASAAMVRFEFGSFKWHAMQ